MAQRKLSFASIEKKPEIKIFKIPNNYASKYAKFVQRGEPENFFKNE